MNDSPWEISIVKCDLLLTNKDGDQIVSIGLADSSNSSIANKGFVRFDKMPKKWCEIYGMNKFSGRIATLRNVKNFWGKVFPLLFALSDGHPLVWQCSQKHARFYKLTFKRETAYKFSFVAGSLTGQKHIYDKNDLTGGSDDEQVVMLELSNP